MSGRPKILKPPPGDPTLRRVRWVDELGNNRQESYRTLAEAKTARDRIAAKLERGTRTSASKITMSAFMREFWTDYAKVHVAAATRERMYLPAMRNWIGPEMGNALLARLDRKAIESFIARMMRQGAQPPTVRATLTTLSSILQRAVEWGYIDVNPARGVRRPTEVVEERDAYEPSEVYAMARNMRLDRDKALVPFTAFTGLRQSEVFGLRWEHIGEDSFKVYRSKSQKWWEVPLFAPAREAIDTWRSVASHSKRGLVFASSSGSRLSGSTWGRRHWQPGLAKAGMLVCAECDEPVPATEEAAKRIAVTTHNAWQRIAEYDRKLALVQAGKLKRMHGPRPLEPWLCGCGFRPRRPGDPQFDGPDFHELRYTFGSLAALATGDLMQVAEWMGHKDTKMLARRYKRQLARGRERAVRQVETLIAEWSE